MSFPVTIQGGIGFDSRDGNVPSSILEASAYIAAYADETHTTGDKGGRLEFGVSKTDDNDDTTSTPVMTIEYDNPQGGNYGTNDNGNVGINTTTPNYALEVHANANTFAQRIFNAGNGSDSCSGIAMRLDPSSTNNARYYLYLNNGGTFAGGIRQTTTANTVDFVDTSDAKLKTDIKDTKYSIDDLSKVKIRDYKWKSTNEPSTGVIAQELLEVFPQFVSENPINEDLNNDETVLGVSYSRFIPIMIKSIQDQQKIINDLQNQINELKTKL